MPDINLKGRSALVVDDETFVQSIVVRMLREFGEPSIETANDGAKAVDLLSAPGKQIDFALVDFNMPEMNGLAFLKAIRTGRSRCRRDLPIALLTGNSDKDLVGRALALDVNAFLLKPTSAQLLGARIERMLSEEPFIQDVEVYDAVELPVPVARAVAERPASVLLDRNSIAGRAGAVRPVDHTPFRPLGPRVRRTIDQVTENAVLASDINNERGICLLRAGVVINRRILSRLRDLGDLKEIDYVWVHLPE